MNCHKSFFYSLRTVHRRNYAQQIYLLSTEATITRTLKLNCNHAIVKADEVNSFRELAKKPVKTLQGIGPVHEKQLSELHIQTVQDLANYKFFHLARAIQTLAATEQDDHRSSKAVMNINKGVDKAYEAQSFKEILQAPVQALQGVSEKAGTTWQQLGVKTINDLANWKYAKWAEALQVVSKYEEE